MLDFLIPGYLSVGWLPVAALFLLYEETGGIVSLCLDLPPDVNDVLQNIIYWDTVESSSPIRLAYHWIAGRNIFRQLFAHKLPERNELFLPGRMAYVIDLEDDMMESDIPTTLIRSKADCPSLEVIVYRDFL